jgi:hypothetical protein
MGYTPSGMSRITQRVIARFPRHELAIERLARRSESFRAMCEDYVEGAEALQRWHDSAADEAKIAQLRESLSELEEEIAEALLAEEMQRADRSRRSR